MLCHDDALMCDPTIIRVGLPTMMDSDDRRTFAHQHQEDRLMSSVRVVGYHTFESFGPNKCETRTIHWSIDGHKRGTIITKPEHRPFCS
jgi:hypothetical protein